MSHGANNLCISEEPNINVAARQVSIVDRIIGGNGFGKAASNVANFFKYLDTKQIISVATGHGLHTGPPNPLNHWGVRVGDILHQLQADHNGKIYYQSVKFDEWGGFDKYIVGATTMNDGAIQSAGIQAIAAMAGDYGLYKNNCQKFVIDLLNLICLSGRIKVNTVYSLREKQVVFVPGGETQLDTEDKTELEVATVEDPEAMEKLLADARAIMEENTPRMTIAEVEEAVKQSREAEA